MSHENARARPTPREASRSPRRAVPDTRGSVFSRPAEEKNAAGSGSGRRADDARRAGDAPLKGTAEVKRFGHGFLASH